MMKTRAKGVNLSAWKLWQYSMIITKINPMLLEDVSLATKQWLA